MTATSETPAARAPWTLWAVGVISLLWNGFGGYDYVMTQTRGEAYMTQMGMGEAQIAAFNAMPAWMSAVWAIGVWGGVLGSVLLLARSRWAVHAFAASLGAVLVSLVYYYGLSDVAQVMGQPMVVMNILITVGALFFLWYSWTMAKRGALR
jgi:hypothetical protein